MSQLALRIKKVYFDQIKNGQKTSEYRQNSSFYQSVFRKDVKVLKLYFNYHHMIVQVKKVNLIDNPFSDRPDFLATDKVYELKLGDIYWIEEPKKT